MVVLMELPFILKLIIALTADFIDFFMPPGIETIYDLFITWVSFKLSGNVGLIQGLELAEPTGRVDAFIPSVTIALFASRFLGMG